MANFWRITKRDYYWTALELKKCIPELKNVDADDITDHLRGTGLGIVSTESVPKPFWVRLSLPFGLILLVFLLITSPIKFMLTGTWGYKVQWLSNWFTALRF